MKNPRFAILAPAVLASLALGCTSSYSPAKDHATSSYDSRDITNMQKVDFIRTTENYLNAVENKVDNWKAEAKDASGSMKEERYEHITDLERKLDRARTELNKLKAASKDDYKGCKEEVDEAVEALNEEIEKANSVFK